MQVERSVLSERCSVLESRHRETDRAVSDLTTFERLRLGRQAVNVDGRSQLQTLTATNRDLTSRATSLVSILIHHD